MIYNDQKPYIFISYAHKDSHTVLAIINELIAAGYNVWWDEGIDPGTEWDENIAAHVKGCGYFVAFVSNNYIASKNCKDELNYSRDLDKDQLLVYLEDVELPQGMAMRMNRIQSIFWGKYPDKKAAFEKLCSAKGIELTKLSNEAPAGWKPAEVPAAPVQSGASGSKNKLPLIIGVAAAALVVIVAAVVLLTGNNKDDSERYEARSSSDEDDEKEERSSKKSDDEDGDEAESSNIKDVEENEDQEAVEKDPADSMSTEVKSEGKGGDILNDMTDWKVKEEDAANYKSFGSAYTRDQISSVVFSSTLPAREDNGLDISVNKDGSVLAWFDQNGGGLYDLTIAADGKIRFPENSDCMFADYTNVISIDFNDAVDAANVKSVVNMFKYCHELRKLDVSCFENAKLTDMGGWFAYCGKMTELEGLDKLDTSQVTSFYYLFYECQALKAIDVSRFDTSSLKNAACMFRGCIAVEDLDVSGFDTSNVTKMGAMFCYCYGLKSLDLSSFDTSKVTDFGMFVCDDNALEELDLTGFSFESTESAGLMFKAVNGKIKIKSADLEKLKSLDQAMEGAENAEFITE